MTAERRYILIVAAIILASAIGIGLIIGIETGDGWRGFEVGGMIAIADVFWLAIFYPGSGERGNH